MLKAPNKMPFDNFKPAKSIKEDQRWKMITLPICLTALHHGQNSLVPSCNAPNRKFWFRPTKQN
jgi:hypothetical protein